MNFETAPQGDHEQARTADHPVNRQAQHRPRTAARENSAPNQWVGMNRVFLQGDKLKVAVKNDRFGAHAPAHRIPFWKGLAADSEEKREPASDIDSVVVDSLKARFPAFVHRPRCDPPSARLLLLL
jgi:hypothetical protein